jgi:HlyD family secretion protein
LRYLMSAVVVVSVAAGFWLFAGAEPQQIQYQTQTLARGDIESVVNTAGTTRAVVTVEVGTEVSGLITELYVDFNDDVSQGQAIAKLDDRSYVAKLRQAQADVVMAQASLAQQQATLTKSNTELARAERAFKRQQQLVQQKLSNQSDLDDALAAFETAQAQILLADAQIQSAQAQLLQRNAQLEQAQLDLDRTTIRSPVNGTVIDRQVDTGQTVAASLSAPTLFTIAQDLSQMQIEADVDEADIGKVQQGQQVRFQVDAYPGQHFRGSVAQVRKAATNTNNVVTYKVIINAPNQQQLLLPGMTANLNIVRGQQTQVLRVPNAALRFKPAGSSNSPATGERPDQAAELINSLQLNAEKAAKVRQLYAAFRDNLQHARAQSAANPMADARQAFSRERQKLQNELQVLLSEPEYQQYLQFNDERRATRQQGATGTAAQVWLLNNAGQPQAVNIRIGLSNDEYSEVLSGAVKDGDAVIVRAVRVD